MPHKEKARPSRQTGERAGNEATSDFTTFLKVLLYGLYVLVTILAACLVTLSWAVGA